MYRVMVGIIPCVVLKVRMHCIVFQKTFLKEHGDKLFNVLCSATEKSDADKAKDKMSQGAITAPKAMTVDFGGAMNVDFERIAFDERALQKDEENEYRLMRDISSLKHKLYGEKRHDRRYRRDVYRYGL